MTTLETKFKIESWDEKPYRETDDKRKWTRSDVALTGTEGLTSGSFEALMYYRPDGTGTWLALLHFAGELDGRSGSFVLEGRGSFDGTSATTEAVITPGSGTGDLAGISGSGVSVSTHADYPYMPFTLTYDLA